jgi:hypothetical protein
MATPDAGTAGRIEQTVMPHLDAAYNLARWLSNFAQEQRQS